MKYPSKSHTITLEEMGAHKIPCFIPNIRPLIDQIYLKNEWNAQNFLESQYVQKLVDNRFEHEDHIYNNVIHYIKINE